MKFPPRDKAEIFTDTEYEKLVLAACNQGATKEQMLWFLKQCGRIRIDAWILEKILSGKLVVREITEHDFRFKLEADEISAQR